MDSRKHGDFSLTSPLGSSRLEKVKRKGLKVAAKKAAGGADDAWLEGWAVREFGAFGLAHAVTGTVWADFHFHLSQTLRVYEMSDLGGEPWTMVRKRGNQSVANDKPFYANGFNTYWLMLLRVSDAPTPITVHLRSSMSGPSWSQFRSRLSPESYSWRRVGGRLIKADSYSSSDSSIEMSDELASTLASIQEFMAGVNRRLDQIESSRQDPHPIGMVTDEIVPHASQTAQTRPPGVSLGTPFHLANLL
uniref:Uncharacterized protein n=1 Tax=Vitis vinifera TaxID=29760 RepID=A5AVE2_VITVI|nr:hypothetical protein VITISV_026112 [Vitis vinifera]